MSRGILVPTFGRFVKAHPHREAPRVQTRELSDALKRHCTTDLHFVAYRLPDGLPFRLSKKSGRAVMQLAVFDVDHAWDLEKTKALRFWKKRPETYIYQTRNGWRIVARLKDLFVVYNAQTDAAWTALYKSWLRYLARVFDIDADPACADWTRLYRLPHAKRDGVVQLLDEIGDPSDVGEWAPSLTEEDRVSVEEDDHDGDELENDHDSDVPLAARLLKAIDIARESTPAVSGESGHNTLLAVTADIYRGCMLPRKAALHVLRNTYSPRCDPPWSDRELEHKLDTVEGAGERWGYLLDDALEDLLPPHEDDAPPKGASGGNLAERLRNLKGRGERQPLGFESIDGDVTRGGIPLESITFIGGAPGAGKTGLVVHQAFAFAKRGYPVAILACDERADGLAIRVGQLLGVSRDGLEAGLSGHAAAERLGDAPISLYDAREGYTLESTAKTLYDAHGPGLLVVDSLQTAAVDAAKKDRGHVEETDAMKRVCKVAMRLAAKYKHAVLFTSELNREYYRNARVAEELNDLAAFKGSGAIEHAADFAMVLRTTPGGKQIRVKVAKNRLGYGYPEFFLEWDPERATMTEVAEVKEDDEGLGDDALGEEEHANLERVVWQIARDNEHVTSKSMLAFAAKRNGTHAAKTKVKEAIDALFLDARLTKTQDGQIRANPWDESGD